MMFATHRSWTTATTPPSNDQRWDALPMAVQRAMSAVQSAPVPAKVPGPGIVDDGYADDDHTSRWIERIEQPHA